MKWDVINIKGEKVKEYDLPESIYGVDMNEAVLHSVVKAYRANRRQGTHATKTRSKFQVVVRSLSVKKELVMRELEMLSLQLEEAVGLFLVQGKN